MLHRRDVQSSGKRCPVMNEVGLKEMLYSTIHRDVLTGDARGSGRRRVPAALTSLTSLYCLRFAAVTDSMPRDPRASESGATSPGHLRPYQPRQTRGARMSACVGLLGAESANRRSCERSTSRAVALLRARLTGNAPRPPPARSSTRSRGRTNGFALLLHVTHQAAGIHIDVMTRNQRSK